MYSLRSFGFLIAEIHIQKRDVPLRHLALKIALAVLFLSPIPASLLASRYSNLWVRWFYTAASSWMGIVYLFALMSIVCWTLYGLAKLSWPIFDLTDSVK
jgi:hypothetical protein